MAYKVPSNARVALQLAQQSKEAMGDVQMGVTYGAGVPGRRMAGNIFQEGKQGAGADFAQDAGAKENKQYFSDFANRLSSSLADQQRGMA